MVACAHPGDILGSDPQPRVTDRFIRESDVKPRCDCAERKCGPHACWPSRWGWGAALALLVYAVVMHSFQIGERADWRGTFGEQIAASNAAWLDSAAEDVVKTMREEAKQITRSVARAEALSWALQTPDVERDLDLRRRVEALETLTASADAPKRSADR